MASRALLGLAALLAALPAFTAEVAGVTLPEQIQLEGKALALNGAGVRQRFIFDVCAVGLYLPQKIADAASVLSAHALLRIWLGDKPVQDDLKQQLLGQAG